MIVTACSYLSAMNIETLKFDPTTGLLPAIIQDAATGRVLMLGYMNRESVQKTVDSGRVTFFSRTRNELWIKGETSGNFLHVVSISDDCDLDAILVKARPDGPTCHTGKESCFDAGASGTQIETGMPFLAYLESFLQERKRTMPEGSYTSKMFAKGLDKIAQKVGEEAVETVIAAKNSDEKEFIYEASDLLFHLTLLLVEKNIPFESLIEELRSRHS
jgi:phosphoribosyl-AMP cyclohydrolase / phosphoribosyl-ATP pyrophosphohydrolase